MMDQDHQTTSDGTSGDMRGRIWSEEELGTFLDIWGSEEILSKMDGTSRNSLVFRTIVSKMKDMGYERTAKEIQNKMKNLKRDYRKVIDHNRRSGNDVKTMPHKEKLDIILGDRPSAEPQHTIQSGRNSTTEMSNDEDSQYSQEDEGFDSLQDWTLDDSESTEEITSSVRRPDIDTGDESSQNESVEDATPVTSRKRPSTVRRNDCRKRTKNTRMRETLSVVSECLDEQLKKFSKSFQEEERKFVEEQKKLEQEFQKTMAQHNESLNKTIESISDMLKNVTNRQNVAMPTDPSPFHSPAGPSTRRYHPWHSTPHVSPYMTSANPHPVVPQHQERQQSVNEASSSHSAFRFAGDDRDFRFYQQL